MGVSCGCWESQGTLVWVLEANREASLQLSYRFWVCLAFHGHSGDGEQPRCVELDICSEHDLVQASRLPGQGASTVLCRPDQAVDGRPRTPYLMPSLWPGQHGDEFFVG